MMADDCGTCLTQRDNYKCGWCAAENKCTIRDDDHCSALVDWLGDNDICPNPEITNVGRECNINLLIQVDVYLNISICV